MVKILFFCTANSCRSPAAAGIFAALAREAGLDDRFWIESAGTHAGFGSPAHPETIQAAALFGIDLTGHRSRPLERSDFREFDLLIGMDRANIDAATPLAPRDNLFKLRPLIRDAGTGEPLDVVDPFRVQGGFVEVHKVIEGGARSLLDELRRRDEIT
jgi:protein-tyrosine phosphatase